MWEKCTPMWRETHVQVKMFKALQLRTHLWKLKCCKSEHRCGAKHMSKSKVLKTDGLGSHFDVQLSFFAAGAMDSAPCQK